MSDNFYIESLKKLNNRYKIIKVLGKSAARTTLLAQDLYAENLLQNLVVIKTLTFNEEFRWEDLKLFEREAETLKNLSHPAIPQYIDYFDLDTPGFQGFALVQNYIAAKSLQEHLQAGRTFSETEIQQIAKSLLEVLHYLHSRQPAVIHRDIKPSNILLTNDSHHTIGDVHLVDFGSVQTAFKESGTRTIVGTYGYMAPEQFGGRAFPASDLYSLGATLIYLATKEHPSKLLDNNLQIQLTPIKKLSQEFMTWLKLITQPSLNCRFKSATIALQTLDSIHNLRFSRIKVKRSVEKLEFIFPAIGVEHITALALFFLFGGTLFTLSPILINWWIFILKGRDFIGYTFSFLVLLAIISILVKLFGRTRIQIDNNNINITKELFGIRTLIFSKTKFTKKNIWKLFSPAKAYKLLDLKYGVEKVEVTPSLIILSKRKAYDLNTFLNEPLTLAERDWIAQEISVWLNIEINQE